MPSDFKTIFVPIQPGTKKGLMKPAPVVDGSHLARDVQATIEEMEYKGFQLLFMEMVNSSIARQGSYRTYNIGALLIFKKDKAV